MMTKTIEWIEVEDSFLNNMNGKLYEWQREREYEIGCKIQIIGISDERIHYTYPKETIYI